MTAASTAAADDDRAPATVDENGRSDSQTSTAADEGTKEPTTTPNEDNSRTQQIQKVGGLRNMKTADFGVAFSVRTSYEAWLSGKVAGQDLSDVYSAGPAIQLDVGLIVTNDIALYLGWQRTHYVVGNSHPYANLPNNSAKGDLFMVGVRGGCGSGMFGLWGATDIGYQTLSSSGSDSAGGTAAVDTPQLAIRAGLGMCIRPIAPLVIAPSVLGVLASDLGSYSGSVTAQGKTSATSGDVQDNAVRFAISPGISVTGELPF